MPDSGGDKIQIQWDDLKTRKVEQRLKEQEALERNRRQAEMTPDTSEIEKPVAKQSLWYHPVFLMAIFGLIGGWVAWGGGEILRFRPDARTEANEAISDIGRLVQRHESGLVNQADAGGAIDELKREYKSNPYFAIMSNTSLSSDEKQQKLDELNHRDAIKNFIADVVGFGLSGMLIATFLSVAEPVVDRNRRALIINGSVGAMLGLLGGVVVSLFADRLFRTLSGDPNAPNADGREVLARAITWGVLGIFLTIAPGVVMRNVKKLGIGVVGGLLGGIVGGALFDLVGNPHISRLIAYVAIGVIAGAGTGLIENAAKNGWLKVTAGLIAGKQFILYRNPTFIGSGPECQIYLFKDAKVGRRHAAIHIVSGGFELENLPLGATTFVNDKPVERVRLRNGDKLQIGGTMFSFQEKNQEA